MEENLPTEEEMLTEHYMKMAESPDAIMPSRLFVVFDEANGIAPEIWDAAKNLKNTWTPESLYDVWAQLSDAGKLVGITDVIDVDMEKAAEYLKDCEGDVEKTKQLLIDCGYRYK